MERLKYIVAAVLLFMVSFVGGCCGADARTAEAYEKDRFVVVERAREYKIIKDSDTGVLYMQGLGLKMEGLTVMLDADGKPLVDKGE